jgi:thiamine pyrophosphokinase
VRSRERDGCLGGKLDLLRTFMVCIDGSALFLKVVKCFPVFLCGDFQSSLLAVF